MSTIADAQQAANGQAVVDLLLVLFLARPAVVEGAVLDEPDSLLLITLPSELVAVILHCLDMRDLASFAATCRALYRHAPPQQESVVAVVLQERAEHRGIVAGQAGQNELVGLLRREWHDALTDQPPLLASVADGQISAFIDSAGQLLTCGTEGVDGPEFESMWVNAIDDSDRVAEMRVLLSPTFVPSDVRRFLCIASGGDMCLAVSHDGKVYSWCSEACHLGHAPSDGAEVDGLAGARVRSVSLGSSLLSPVFAAVTENGSLYTWGSILDSDDDVADAGPSGIGYPAFEMDDEYVELPRQVVLRGVCVRSVALGAGFSLILAADGRLFSCGRGQYGALGHGDEEQDVVRPKQIEALQRVRVCGVAASDENSLALTRGGMVYSWGAGEFSGLGLDVPMCVLLPTLIKELSGVIMVAAGAAHACAVTNDGALFNWGYGMYGALGHGDEVCHYTPRRVHALRGCRIATVATGDAHTLAAAEDGSVYGFGLSSRLGLGTASYESQVTPKRIPNLKV